MSEDVNVEHLLNVLTTVDPDGGGIWEACYHIMNHLYWHKPRQTVPASKIEALADDNRLKLGCMSQLSRLLGAVGNYVEEKRLLTRTLEIERQWGDGTWVARILQDLS